MKRMQTYYQLIPERVNQALPVIDELISPDIPGYCGDCLRQVISIVACHVRKDEGVTPLKVNYIKKMIPQGDKYLNALIDLDIVERSGYYVPGQVSYKYGFSQVYESKYVSIPLNNAKLIRRIEMVMAEFNKEATRSVRGHTDQVAYLRQLTIEPECFTYIHENYTADTQKFNAVLRSATRILNGDITYKVDSTSGRFHSNVTNCPKGFRQYLRVNGEPLVNIDIKNSQPYLSTILLTNPSKVSYLTENAAFAMVLQKLKVTLTEDVRHYISLVISGQLYEYLMQEFAAEGLPLTRKETKVQVLRILFARNRSPKDQTNRKAREIFKARFPVVHRIFNKIRGSQQGDKFASFKRFAVLLQRIESHLMLEVVLKRISRELPGTIAITVHDSIMTGILTNNVEAVRKILTEELAAFVGFEPQTEVEGWEERIEGNGGIDIFSNQYDATNLVNYN